MAAVAKRYVAMRPVDQPHDNQVLSQWIDLEKAGCSKAALSDKLREIFNCQPDSVCVNEGLCMEYGHFCYTQQKECTFENLRQTTVMSTGSSKIIENDTTDSLEVCVRLESTQKVGASLSVTKASDFSFGKTIRVNIAPDNTDTSPASLWQLLTIENTPGYTSSNFEDSKVGESVRISLKPGQRASVAQELSWTEIKGDFAIVFTIDGWCMCQFPVSVNGQRIWLHEIESLFETPVSVLRGNFKCVYDLKSSVTMTTL